MTWSQQQTTRSQWPRGLTEREISGGAIIVEVGTEATGSNVGTGSTTEFTGIVTRPIVTGNRYEVTEIPLNGEVGPTVACRRAGLSRRSEV